MSHASYLPLLFLLAASMGCVSVCDSSMDRHYNAYGGLRDRIDRVNGRVGSQFDPAAVLEHVPRVTDSDKGSPGPEMIPVPDAIQETDEGDLARELLDALDTDEQSALKIPKDSRPL